MRITIHLPDELIGLWPSEREPAQEILLAVLLEEYRQGRISHGKIGSVLDLDYWETEQLLRERGVPLNYSEADLRDDCQTLREYLK